jgi:S-adenosylmethionine:tRNA ribosyltransferase-isomerase
VETEFVEQHPMHAEWCTVPRPTADAVDAARAAGARVFAVGTTAARTLESFRSTDEMRASGSRVTRLLITPGYRFRHVDALLTNFHLPRSTLMAMVAAMLPGGAAQLRDLYAQALARGYRFYSYGDAMLIV